MSGPDAPSGFFTPARRRADGERLHPRAALLVVAGASLGLWSSVATVAAGLVG
jgi:hypothetical protein